MALYKASWERDGKRRFRDFHTKKEADTFAKLPREVPVKVECYKEPRA